MSASKPYLKKDSDTGVSRGNFVNYSRTTVL